MKFVRTTFIWLTSFGWPDVSFGLHWCWKGRLDIHFLIWMLSIGNVPLYRNQDNKLFAVSNSFHTAQDKRRHALRAGVPH